MNSKKQKNKKSNKQHQLKNLQNDDKILKLKDSQVHPVGSEIKDESVQDLNSELTNNVEHQENEITVPKKPKRNKGKKKKQDTEDDSNKEQENKLFEPSKTEVDDNELSENVNQNLPEVMPVVRKKKNKKKDIDLSSEMMQLHEQKSKTFQFEQDIRSESNDSETNSEKIESLDMVKIVNKKNKKKKNRNNSEKSDKCGEVSSCTSAFQKLLNEDEDIPMDDMNELDINIIVEDNSNVLVSTEIILETDKKFVELKHTTPSGEIDNPTEDIDKTDDARRFDIEIKKNKKPKKVLSDINNFNVVKEIITEKQLILETSETLQKSDETKSNEEQSLTNSLIKKGNQKSQSKIVKPIEKKSKEKQESHIKSSTFICDSENKEDLAVKPLAGITVANEKQETTKPDSIKLRNFQDDTNKDQPIATLVLDTSDNLIVKKKKKLPKIHEVVNIIIDETEQTTSLHKDSKLSTNKVSQDTIKDEVIFETLVPIDFEMKIPDDKLNEILSTITEMASDNLKKEDVDDSDKLIEKNTKSRKSDRKIPNILIKTETYTVENPEIFKQTENLETNAIDNGNDCSTLTPSDDIEDQSVKADESKVLKCDVTPVILHPRSTSEHLTDDNNNTIIQEIFEDTFDIDLSSQDVPAVQGSGETTIEIPNTLPPVNQPDKFETTFAKAEENIDIKSKIIEVNKDMEVLKLSIEKSLAGLSALEQSEDVSDKHLKKVNCDNENILQEIRENTTSEVMAPNVDESEVATVFKEIDGIPDASYIKNVGEEKISKSEKDQFKYKETIKIILSHDQPDMHSLTTLESINDTPPVCPARRENKKGKKTGNKEKQSESTNSPQIQSSEISIQYVEKEVISEHQTNATKKECKQQSTIHENIMILQGDQPIQTNVENDYEPIEHFEDALTSSSDDINKKFEMIVNQIKENPKQELDSNKPEINIIAPIEDSEQKYDKENPELPPKNFLGYPDMPARSNKIDYKKEKDKTPNTKQPKVKLRDNDKTDKYKESKQSQTEKMIESKRQSKFKHSESFCQISNCDNFIYKYSFRKVFLQSICHVCKKELVQFRVPCKFCSLLFYCSLKHKDEDWPQHQALCFAVSTIVHLKDQKHIYAEAKNITGHNYRLLRMQTILSCEKVLKRRLMPWEQEALLYPRMCSDAACREWRQSKLKDCERCGQISYCSAYPEHLSKNHQRWCKSYALYQKLVTYQQTKGRLEPKLPTKVLKEYQIPEKINEVLASLFEEKIDLNDVQYAALTQIATAPLTVAFCHQIYRNIAKGVTKLNKMSDFTIHVVGAELQFEADVLNKWEIFFLHLRPDIKELRVVLISPDLNPGKLPLELLGRIKLCDSCCQNRRRVVFSFQDKKSYQEYREGDDFIYPDIVCAFNPNLHRSSVHSEDLWPSTITAVTKLKTPFVITGHTITELHRDLVRVQEWAETEVMVGPRLNPFSSVRPDRNFISDDEVPLLFKNHCFVVLRGF